VLGVGLSGSQTRNRADPFPSSGTSEGLSGNTTLLCAPFLFLASTVVFGVAENCFCAKRPNGLNWAWAVYQGTSTCAAGGIPKQPTKCFSESLGLFRFGPQICEVKWLCMAHCYENQLVKERPIHCTTIGLLISPEESAVPPASAPTGAAPS
jgi:hypothetical protein